MNEEEQIKKLFLELKRAEELTAPAFENVWAAAAARRETHRWRGYFLRVAASAAALAGLAVAAFLILHRQDFLSHKPTVASGTRLQSELAWQSTLLVSDWRSPTDFLLEPPGVRLLQSDPSDARKN